MGRGLLILIAVLSIAFWISSISARRKRARELGVEWLEKGGPGRKESYVEAGLAVYDRSMRRWALLAIYAVPLAAIVCIIYVVNFM